VLVKISRKRAPRKLRQRPQLPSWQRKNCCSLAQKKATEPTPQEPLEKNRFGERGGHSFGKGKGDPELALKVEGFEGGGWGGIAICESVARGVDRST